jgi:hypothetical protein
MTPETRQRQRPQTITPEARRSMLLEAGLLVVGAIVVALAGPPEFILLGLIVGLPALFFALRRVRRPARHSERWAPYEALTTSLYWPLALLTALGLILVLVSVVAGSD